MFISTAYAQSAMQSGNSNFFIPLILIALAFYFIIIKPQQKEMKKKQEMLKELKRGDQVVTVGGIFGTVKKTDVEKDSCLLEIASEVEINIKLSKIEELILGKETKKNKETKKKTK
ncbi:MAG: preprotein translocase subunit YajC [Rickettsiales bacterium]|nr:preprotein translocase subunit YajC [Rickettsiales bacterium]